MNNPYEEYALLVAKEEEIAIQKAALKVRIMEDMANRGETKQETATGKFSISKLKSWTYPQYVIDAEDEYKAIKAKSQTTGDATYEENESLRFNPVKL